MRAMLAAVMVMGLSGVAWADCWEAGTGADAKALAVEFCYDGKCEQTSIDGYCKASGARGITFHNGWNVSWDVDNGKYAEINDQKRDPSLLSCKALFDRSENTDVISPSCWFLGLD